MRFRVLIPPLIWLLAAHHAGADDLLYQYEGDVLPYDESAGWRVFGACDFGCREAIENGRHVFYWPSGGSLNYDYSIAEPPTEPPASPWVEWRFRSNYPKPPNFYTCDGRFSIDYGGIEDLVYMFGDAAVSFSGGDAVTGLAIEEFHTYRFESVDGTNYWISVDGVVFITDAADEPRDHYGLQFRGGGGCTTISLPTVNEWDFIRFGAISYGEQIVASDPPSGFLDARRHAGLDRFTVSFDSPNYVYIDEITVETSGADLPVVTQTRRREDDGPETVEIVLDRPIAMGETARFTFDDGVAVNAIEYTFAPADTDGDGDVDLFDVAVFQNCFESAASSGPCMACDRDGTGWVHLNDFALFADELVGPLGNAQDTENARIEGGNDGLTWHNGPGRAGSARRKPPIPRRFIRSTAAAPMPCELGKLTASDAASTDYFGRSVGVSGDWAVVGTWQDDDAGSTSGSAYVFRRELIGTPSGAPRDTWMQHTKLTASDAAPYTQFGYSVAIDGHYLVVGTWKDDEADFAAGSAYVFRRDENGTPGDPTDDTWTEEAKLTADNGARGDNFGVSVSIDGDLIVVGTYRHEFYRGAAYVFRRVGTAWRQEAKLTASDRTQGDLFGFSVSISGDHVLVGAYGNDDDGSASGSAYIFRHDDNGTPADQADDTWVEQAKLTASDAQWFDRFGWSVGISGDRAVVGAYRVRAQDVPWHSGRGAAYVFERDDNATPEDPTDDIWVEQAKLTASNGAPRDRFGHSVAIDGNYIVVGANLGDAPRIPDSGAAYLFELQGTDWIEVAQLSASDAAWADGFGRSVSISGNQILVGAWADDDAGLSSGSAYLFSTDADCPNRP